MKKFIVGVMGFMLATSVMAGNFSAYYSTWDAGDAGQTGIGGGIRVDSNVSDYFGVEFRLTAFNQFDDDPSDNLFIVPIEVGLFGQLPLAENRIVIYGGGGIGYYIMPEFENEDGTDVDVEDVVGFYVVGGARLMFSDQAGIFAEVKQTMVEPDEIEIPDADVTVDFDGDLTGVMINIGLVLGW